MIGTIITITVFCLVGIWLIGYDEDTDEWTPDQYPEWLQAVLDEGTEAEETDMSND